MARKSSDESPSTESSSPQPPIETPSETTSTPPPFAPRSVLTILSGWLLFTVSWGPSLSFGVFQQYYQASLLPSHSASSISWIGAIQAFLLLATGAFLGPLFDRGYFYPSTVVGCVLLVGGQVALSFVRDEANGGQYWQVFLAQGLCVGLGAGVVYVPCTSLVANLFAKRKERAVAMSVMLTGISFGGVIYPVVFRRLQPSIGFAWTVRVMALMALVASLAALGILSRLPPKTTRPRKLFEWDAFREPAFMFFSISGFFNFLAYWIPLFYVPTFAQTALRIDEGLSYYLICVVNAGQLIGRLLPAFIIPYTGAMPLAVPVNFAAAVILFAWIGVVSTAGFVVWCVVLGIVTGLLTGTNPTAAAHPTLTHISVYGTRWGIATVIAAFGTLVGTPIAGALADPTFGQFLHVQIFAGAIMAVGAILYLWPLLVSVRHDRAETAKSSKEST